MNEKNLKVISDEQLNEYRMRLLKLCGEYQKHILHEINRIKANCMIEHSNNFCKARESIIFNDIGHIEECFGEVMRLDALYGEPCEFVNDEYEDDYVCSLENECKRETSASAS